MLRKKTLLGVGATVIVLIVVLYVVTRQIVLNEFFTLEQQLVTRNLSRVTSILADDEQSLQSSLVDWSEWDDTYAFMQSQSPDYLSNNISANLYGMYRLNIILYLGMDGQVVYSGSVDAASSELVKTVTNKLDQDEVFRHEVLPDAARPVKTPSKTDIVRTPSGPLLIAISPILNSFGEGAPRGVLIWGRYLGSQEAQRLSTLTSLPVNFVPLNEDGTPTNPLLAQVKLDPLTSSAVVPTDESTSHGYILVKDDANAPAFIFDVTVSRDVYQRGQVVLNYLVLLLVAAGVVIGAVVLILLDRLVLGRLARLNRDVVQIGQRDDLSLRVAENGNDELANLGHGINTTLDALANSRAELTSLNVDLEARVAARTSELQARQKFLQAVLDTMKEGVIFGSPDAIYSVNDVMLDMCGHAHDALIGRPSHLLFDDTLTALLRRVENGGGKVAHHGEGWLLCKDGTRLDVSVTVSPPVELDGQLGAIYVIRDITEEKALQARKDRFLADASHELRNPLTNLMTRLYLLRQQPERLDAHLEILDTIVLHMRSLVEDLLDSTRFRQGTTPLKREITLLQPLIEAVIEQQRPEADLKHMTLTSALPKEPICASIDSKRITQVITNLLANAIHYTNEGGSIHVALIPDGESALVTVRDSGIGISEENQSQLFMPFFRVNPDTPGTGLGLAIVKEIIDRHDGQISVDSALGQGTTFTIRLATVPTPYTAPV